MASESTTPIKIGTRRSALALAQTNIVIAGLQRAYPHLTFEVHAMATMGDRDQTTPLPALGKGLWTNELEAKLASREVDAIVHCLKDMPTTLPEGCILGAVTAREDPRDVVIFAKRHEEQGQYKRLGDLPAGSVVGTSSVRRAAQLRRSYPGLVFRDVRGNIQTRLRKCDEEGYDAIILAAAGLLRMDLGARIAQYLDSNTEGGGMLHAVGQGALGLEIREGDERMEEIVKAVLDRKTMMEGFAERAVMRTLEGGCSVPIGVETSWVEEGEKKKLRLRATVVSLDGKEAVYSERTEEITSLEQAETMGRQLAQKLAGMGAQKILDDINKGRESGAALKVSDA
ncbi:hypothetical protein VTI74DRAFT_4206 [Chaetomium olivicolor]